LSRILEKDECSLVLSSVNFHTTYKLISWESGAGLWISDQTMAVKQSVCWLAQVRARKMLSDSISLGLVQWPGAESITPALADHQQVDYDKKRGTRVQLDASSADAKGPTLLSTNLRLSGIRRGTSRLMPTNPIHVTPPGVCHHWASETLHQYSSVAAKQGRTSLVDCAHAT
jgi:hypothetical protein